MKKNFYALLISAALILIAALTINSMIHKRGSASKDVANPSLSTLYNEAKGLESKEAYLDAQAIYREILEIAQDEELIQKVHKDLSGLNMRILFSPIVTEDSMAYTVKKGDTLGKIAKRFNTTVELIMRSNNLKSDIIRIGERLKISMAKYSVVVDCSQNILTLRSRENILKTYKVSTGMNDSTPLGMFKVVNKLKDPVWYKTGAIVPSGSPDNILGSRWMGISIARYGIHGTTQPETIGKNVTAGCVRMREPDAQELYSILPIGTEVTIVE